MYRSFKMCGERGVILNDGTVVGLSALALKMLDFVKFPLEPSCPSALRYALAKFDSGDVNNAYGELLAVQAYHTTSEAHTVRTRIVDQDQLSSLAENDIAYLRIDPPSDAAIPLIADIYNEYSLSGVIVTTDNVERFKAAQSLLSDSGIADCDRITMGITATADISGAVTDKFKQGVTSVWCDITKADGKAESELSRILKWIILSGEPKKYSFMPVSTAIVQDKLCAAVLAPEFSSDISVEEALTRENSPELARLIAAAALKLHCEEHA